MAELEAPIKEVTVYSDRALITRRGTIQLETGEHELRINNLPQFIRDSLRASGQGPEGTRILNVDVTTAFYSRPPEEELLNLQNALEQLQQNKQLLKARQDSLNDRRQWLRALGEQSRDFAKGLAQGQMHPDDCANFFSFMANQALQDAEAAQNLEIEMKRIQQDIDARQRELRQKQGDQLPDRLAAVVNVELTQAGAFELELSYLVTNASWHPQYDVRVQMNEEHSEGEVELTYIGMVQQATGERWENVNLALSTARPSLAGVLPELDPWYLKVYAPLPPHPVRRFAVASASPDAAVPQAAIARERASLASSDDFSDEAIPPFAAAAPASIATATVEHTGTAIVFHVGRSVDIPSDNTPHKTTIARDNLPCSFDYVSAPALEEYAHLRATITNTSEHVLLKGSASIFLSGEYVGTTQIKQTASAEEFKVFLGIDDSVKIQRELIERSVDKGNLLQNDIRRITYAYRITVHNYGSASRKIVVRDRLPVAQHERIKIKNQTIQPQPTERTKLEILVWRFTLPADGEQKIEYRFVVEHTQDLQVIGLPS
ncbi:MAG: mucoidy inhibitor MuiA family protein [Ktedonobacteraceae bacterium]|nr:mucoidy inhibitor MuiA family protein [Ktedonobacteraceae bacterium]